ncbi:low temperature requirement protein A [Acanthopleuribacter pedis]|uniref:Low temperature requirement protein A n=1 Tax=Acanthopleuribacter pedis TaxID=442870 RepID=A0A8J7Q713_9BACT|nr:low temperature requirement protein A [Acanthopleuribacter pedis]MBO1321742.1 low temperature requirement protein A [Acanthopleuribacter pedis]
MRSRWFHKPTIHTAHSEHEKRAGWLELFYDLIFVASFIQLGNALSDYVSIERFVGFVALFTPLWVIWTGFTHFANRFDVDDFMHRLMVFLQMFSVGAMVVTVPQALAGNHQPFAFACSAALLLVALFYLRTHTHQTDARDSTRHWFRIYLVAASIWFVSGFVPKPAAYFGWFLGVAAVITAPLGSRSRALAERYPIDFEHLSERYGLLTLIVLGESFVKVLAALTQHAELGYIIPSCFGLLLICSMWWIYFDDVAGSHLRKSPLAYPLWLYGHLPLQFGMIAVGVALKKVTYFDMWEIGEAKYRWLLCGSLAITFFAAALIDSVSERKHAELSDHLRVNVRLFSGFVILLLAAAGGAMPAIWFLTMVAAVGIIQVAFDMMMAPMEEHQLATPATTLAELAKQDKPQNTHSRIPDVAQAVRRGTPSNYRSDLYVYFMQGSWTSLLLTAVTVFLLLNVIFASLYLLVPGSIENAAGKSFADAFFFSVQTMSTVGYGTLNPGNLYGNIVATVEAGVSLLCIALITGLMFAKASRPRASVIFSKPILLTRYDGKPVLMLRAGNARGNELMDATITLSMLRDEFTEEDIHVRRVHDLKLVRNHTPFFSLTWQVIHMIDEESPLYGMEWEEIPNQVVVFMATIMGHDGTYGQTNYARHTYQPEDLRCNQRFVDVLSNLEDGRIMVDYEKFHQTVPLETEKSKEEA